MELEVNFKLSDFNLIHNFLMSTKKNLTNVTLLKVLKKLR